MITNFFCDTGIVKQTNHLNNLEGCLSFINSSTTHHLLDGGNHVGFAAQQWSQAAALDDESGSACAEHADPRGYRIMIVDDESIVRRIRAQIVEDHEVIEAVDG